MSKLSKFIVVLVLGLIVLSNCSYSFAAVDMNLGNSSTSGNSTTTTTDWL